MTMSVDGSLAGHPHHTVCPFAAIQMLIDPWGIAVNKQ